MWMWDVSLSQNVWFFCHKPLTWVRAVYMDEVNEKITTGRARVKKRNRTVNKVSLMSVRNSMKGTFVSLDQYAQDRLWLWSCGCFILGFSSQTVWLSCHCHSHGTDILYGRMAVWQTCRHRHWHGCRRTWPFNAMVIVNVFWFWLGLKDWWDDSMTMMWWLACDIIFCFC